MRAESARQEWEEGYRRIQGSRSDARRYRALLTDADLVRDELRRRVGQSFTLAELADEYVDADRWMREVVSDPLELPLIGAAAFHLHARGATDYSP
ncbi:MAG: hypothetical protein H0W87_04455 [Actinobacteria bacterium]|nr:hypothetical protein [Actinomycetota bacterium]